MEISSSSQVGCRDDVIPRLLICARYSNVPSNSWVMQRTWQLCKVHVRGQFDELVLRKLYNDELNDFLMTLSVRTAKRIVVKFDTGGVSLNSLLHFDNSRGHFT